MTDAGKNAYTDEKEGVFMKKYLLILGIALLICNQPAMAENVKVEAMSDFTTANPPSTWNLKIVEGFTTKAGFEVAKGSVITGKITDVTNPKRLKQDASFKFIPVSFYDAKTGETYQVKKDLVGKYNSLGDIKAGDIVEKGAIAAGNHFISCTIGPGVALVKGVVKNEEGNRVKSAAVSVYESTPLSYVSKGKEREIKQGQQFTMNFTFNEED